MKVVVMHPNGQICTQNISRPVHRSAGAIVGGLIETVNPVRLQRPYCMLVNESFLIDGLPINPVGSYLYGADLHGHPICGNVIISRVTGEDLETLTDHEAQQLVRTMEAVKRLLTKEEQPGDTFTAKFEWLVMRCTKELPAAEWRLQRLNKDIKEREQLLRKLREQYTKASRRLQTMEQRMEALDYEISRALDEWKSAEA